MVQPQKLTSNKPPKNNQHIRKCAFQPEGNREGEFPVEPILSANQQVEKFFCKAVPLHCQNFRQIMSDLDGQAKVVVRGS